MKITKSQLRRIIREAMVTAGTPYSRSPDAEMAADAAESGAAGMSKKSFRVPYEGFGYGGRRIISRDRAWLEFVPKGADPSTQEDMFRSVTLLDQGDPEVEKVIARGGWYVDKYLKGPVDNYDVYSVYATTTG